jgi:hypothetical protein
MVQRVAAKLAIGNKPIAAIIFVYAQVTFLALRSHVWRSVKQFVGRRQQITVNACLLTRDTPHDALRSDQSPNAPKDAQIDASS